MLEKTIAVAIMIAIVGVAFHMFGEVDRSPQAVVALMPQENIE